MTTADVPIDVPVHHVSAFDIEDAFSDGDEIPAGFSAGFLREELARNLSAIDTTGDDASTSNGSADNNTSVSTLDITRDTFPSPADGPHPRRLPYSADYDEDVPAHFSQISLAPSDEESESQGRMSLNSSDGRSPVEQDLPYPNVVIDASQASDHHVSVLNGSPSVPPLPFANPQHNGDEPTPRLPSASPPAFVASSHNSHPNPSPHSTNVATSATHLPSSAQPQPETSPSPASTSQLGTPPAQPTKPRKPGRSSGPSMLEKVRSKTRPTHLPPKNRQEDDRHMADWEAMMKLSRQAGTPSLTLHP